MTEYNYPRCKECGGPMAHFRLSGYRCMRNREHKGIVWPKDSPQAQSFARLPIKQALRDNVLKQAEAKQRQQEMDSLADEENISK